MKQELIDLIEKYKGNILDMAEAILEKDSMIEQLLEVMSKNKEKENDKAQLASEPEVQSN